MTVKSGRKYLLEVARDAAGDLAAGIPEDQLDPGQVGRRVDLGDDLDGEA